MPNTTEGEGEGKLRNFVVKVALLRALDHEYWREGFASLIGEMRAQRVREPAPDTRRDVQFLFEKAGASGRTGS